LTEQLGEQDKGIALVSRLVRLVLTAARENSPSSKVLRALNT
jgi:hypothetical protein